MPRARSATIASRDVGLIGSATASSPASAPSTATYTGVFAPPESRAAVVAQRGDVDPALGEQRLPFASTSCPDTLATAPRPSPTESARRVPARARLLRAAHDRVGQRISLDDSSDAASASSSSLVRLEPSTSTTSVTVGRPSVTVPVLSSTTVSTAPARCASPPLISTPASAPRPVATITAVGTASPIAQGQAMISTATAAANARTAGAWNPATVPATNHTTNVATRSRRRRARTRR